MSQQQLVFTAPDGTAVTYTVFPAKDGTWRIQTPDHTPNDMRVFASEQDALDTVSTHFQDYFVDGKPRRDFSFAQQRWFFHVQNDDGTWRREWEDEQ